MTLDGLWRGLAALAGAGSLGAVALAVALSRPGPPVQAPVAITVEEGERFAEVAADLARQGVLRHPLPLILWGRLTRQDRNVHWGEYLITRPLTPIELLARITGPPDPLHEVVVPEGRTLREVVALLAAAASHGCASPVPMPRSARIASSVSPRRTFRCSAADPRLPCTQP